MDTGVATTVAAVIAAVASILSLVINLSASKRAEMRAAHREAISPYLKDLSEDMHTIVASIVVMRKRVALGVDIKQWRDRSKEAGSRVEVIRRQTTFLFSGLDHPLRQLALASDHVATYKDIPDSNVDELVNAYRALSDRVSRALSKNYRTGTPTGWLERLMLKLAADKAVKTWDRRPTRDHGQPN